ncbi:MAG: CoA transferase [Gammaproteobacteria bacterium]|nr:CoA transferase [Gammaproteobacteria bacterium]
MTDKTSNEAPKARPLDGIRVLELGQLIAGPFAGSLLAYYGAEVIKVEPPDGGDQLRGWRELDENGMSFWWRGMSRNKKCVTINLRERRGQALVKSLTERVDVVLENFRPGTLEKWGLAPDELRKVNPGLIVARVSGYGQTGPLAARPGFASACEGYGGFRHINGFPGQAPVRPNISMGDTLAAMNAVIGILLALVHRNRIEADRLPGAAGGVSGQDVDIAIFEAVYGMLESTVSEFDARGVIREPSGTTLTGIVPTNTYPCQDDKYVVIGGNGDSIYKRLMKATGRTDLADDPRLATNAGRVTHQAEVDQAIAEWTRTLPLQAVMQRLDEAGVPNGPIFSVQDMFADEHYQARGLFEQVEVDGRPLKIPAYRPLLSATPGRTDWPGAALGAHNEEILGGLLGLDEATRQTLAENGII